LPGKRHEQFRIFNSISTGTGRSVIGKKVLTVPQFAPKYLEQRLEPEDELASPSQPPRTQVTIYHV
jgi:hypothetical protein